MSAHSGKRPTRNDRAVVDANLFNVKTVTGKVLEDTQTDDILYKVPQGFDQSPESISPSSHAFGYEIAVCEHDDGYYMAQVVAVVPFVVTYKLNNTTWEYLDPPDNQIRSTGVGVAPQSFQGRLYMAGASTPTGYCEKHHIFSKSIFGNNFVVTMIVRQHYIARAFREKIYIHRYGLNNSKTRKMIYAFFMMRNIVGKGQDRYVNSRLVEASKLRFIKQVTGKNSPQYGKKRVFSEQHIERIRASRKHGKDNPYYGTPRSPESIKKINKPKRAGHGEAVSKARKGIVFRELDNAC